MSIKRYRIGYKSDDIYCERPTLVEDIEGNLALYTDHAAERDRLKAEKAELLGALKEVRAHHQWVMDEHVWHLEANAQVGLLRLLKRVDSAIAKASKTN